MTKTPMEGTAFCKIMNCNTVCPTEKKKKFNTIHLLKAYLTFMQ